MCLPGLWLEFACSEILLFFLCQSLHFATGDDFAMVFMKMLIFHLAADKLEPKFLQFPIIKVKIFWLCKFCFGKPQIIQRPQWFITRRPMLVKPMVPAKRCFQIGLINKNIALIPDPFYKTRANSLWLKSLNFNYSELSWTVLLSALD